MDAEETKGNRDGAEGTAIEGASVIVLRGDSVLMVRRARPPAEGLWSFPGGKLEPGETAEDAARRELLEETGLVAGTLVELGRFRPAPDRSPIVLTVFGAGESTGDPVAGDDAAEAEFVPLPRILARSTTPGAPRWIAEALLALKCPGLECREGREIA